MKVLFATVEMSPLVKVGGLADVAGALPKALVAGGEDVRVVMPFHQGIDTPRYGFQRILAGIPVRTARGSEELTVWQGEVGGVTVYLLGASDMFMRPQVYGEPDDNERWLFYCDAVLAAMPQVDWRPDVLHLNDWHTAFIASRLRTPHPHPFAGLPIVFTIHNLAFKGDFDDAFVIANGLDIQPHRDLAVEPWMLHSGMGQGIVHADLITTVSPTYAREILTPEYGAGLDPLLRQRAGDLEGILNGIDGDEFDPATDPRLPAHFTADDLAPRSVVRRALATWAGWPDDRAPVAGFVSRLFWQKGADIAVDGIGRLLAEGVPLRFAVLGTGEEQYERALRDLQGRFLASVAVEFAFDPDLAPLIYGGSDLFLMPSRYEPCGLGQMIAMRYGSVPVVRRTGGLADTVPDADEHPDEGRGFAFDEPDGAALAEALRRALAAYHAPERWRRIQLRGMRADFSWTASARQYARLYARATGGADERES